MTRPHAISRHLTPCSRHLTYVKCRVYADFRWCSRFSRQIAPTTLTDLPDQKEIFGKYGVRSVRVTESGVLTCFFALTPCSKNGVRWREMA